MGSAGDGRFGVYGDGHGGSGATIGTGRKVTSGNDCPTSVEAIKLEDVSICPYYTNNEKLPPVGLDVFLDDKLFNKRPVICDATTKEVIGNLPTEHFKLYECTKSGHNYIGKVVSSGMSPVPFVVVDLHV